MMTPPSTRQEVTQLLGDWSGGDDGALEKLFPLVQPELHRLAHHYMSRERAGHTLQTTVILDEAYLRLVDNTKPLWQGRTHFIAVAAQLMRRIIVDHARERHSLKRGGGALKVTLDEAALVTETRSEELLALDEALDSLAAQDPRKSQIVELRYFGGLTVKETAEFLKLSQRTVEREWTMAKAWLYRPLSEQEPGSRLSGGNRPTIFSSQLSTVRPGAAPLCFSRLVSETNHGRASVGLGARHS